MSPEPPTLPQADDPSRLRVLAREHADAGRIAEAEDLYRRLAAAPGCAAEGFFQIARLKKQSGQPDAALAFYDRALTADPNLWQAYNAKGMMLAKLVRLEEAAACYGEGLKINPASGELHNNLGNTLRGLGRNAEALAHYRRAQELAQGDRSIRLNAACALDESGDAAGAEAALRVLIRDHAVFAEAYYYLGLVLQKQGRQAEAAALFAQAVSHDPESAAARWALTMAQLPPVYSEGQDPAVHRAAFDRELAGLEAWFGPERSAAGADVVGAQTPFLLAYRPDNNRELLARHGALCARLMQTWQRNHGCTASRGSTGKIQVAIVSKHIHEHSVWRALVRGWLTHVDRSRFDLHVFHLAKKRDGETALAQANAASFTEGARSLEEWVKSILACTPDIVIYPEIGMDTLTLKLAAQRLAPVQLSTWGHPETTGLPTIDYFLSAEDLEPRDGDANYTETLVRLPGLGCCYEPLPLQAVAPDLSALGLKPGAPLLLCPGSPYKYAPEHDWVWPEIAKRLPGGKLIFFTFTVPALSDILRKRLAAAFTAAGVPFDAHVVFVPWQPPDRFYGWMSRATVFLDTLGFSGFNTATQAVECGLPVVTCEGRFMRGRLAAGILCKLGLPDLVCPSPEEYIARAVRIATDPVYRAEIVQRMGAARPRLFGDMMPIRALESFLASVARKAP